MEIKIINTPINKRKIIHEGLASGRWYKFSFVEQMANIGSEVGRARHWLGKDKERCQGAVDRALELFDLTLEDPRWKGRLREIGRVREVFCDAITGGKEYKSSFQDLEQYFLHFAIASRRDM